MLPDSPDPVDDNDEPDAGDDDTNPTPPVDEEAAPQPDVVCTILCNPDGTYVLVQGDEPEAADMSAPEEGEESAAPAAPPGQQFDSIGALLKGVLEIIKEHDANRSGEGTDEDNFTSGYSGQPATQSRMGGPAGPSKPAVI